MQLKQTPPTACRPLLRPPCFLDSPFPFVCASLPPPAPLQNLCGLIPLALLLGEVTEDLALRLGEVMGGLLVSGGGGGEC